MRRRFGRYDVRPSADSASGATLADRVRSSLGPLLKDLDLPRVHVMAVGNHVMLHGDVDNVEHARQIESAAFLVTDVESVESYLHLGLIPSDSRPSDATSAESTALRSLKEAVTSAGVHGPPADRALRATIGTFLRELPRDERRHVIAHLPEDVQALAGRRLDRHAVPLALREDDTLESTVHAASGLPVHDAHRVIANVLHVVARLVPEECADISAVLGGHTRHLWETARSAQHA